MIPDDCSQGCRGPSGLSADFTARTLGQDALSPEKAACGYDSTFDFVDLSASGAFNLAEYLVWVGRRAPDAAKNATLMHTWIEHFHK